MRILPLKRAATGPTRVFTTACHSLSDRRSSDSHPGMHSFNMAGSFSAFHTASGGACTIRVLDISIRGPSFRRPVPPSLYATLNDDHRSANAARAHRTDTVEREG